MTRKYLPTLAELIDRLAIIQLKEVFITEHKDEYAQEISEITHDIEEILNEDNIRLTGKDGRKDYKIDCIAAEFKDWEISWEK